MNKRIRKKKQKQWEHLLKAEVANLIEKFHISAPLVGVQSETSLADPLQWLARDGFTVLNLPTPNPWFEVEMHYAGDGMNKVIYDLFVKPSEEGHASHD